MTPIEAAKASQMKLGDYKYNPSFIASRLKCSQEDAAHIVKCVNSHDELLEAFKEIQEQVVKERGESMTDDQVWHIAQRAIVQAEGK
jgi:hypothetical protein